MSYTVENVNNCTKKFIFNLDTAELMVEINSALNEKKKTVQVKGFRKGKAPMSVVRDLFGGQIEEQAVNKFVQNNLFTAINENKLQVVGYEFEKTKYDSGKELSFDAIIETMPEFEIKSMDELSFTKDKVEVTDEEVEEVKKNYLASKAEMTPVTDLNTTIENGLFGVLNFQGIMENGDAPENMKGQEYLLEIGAGQFVPGLEEGIVGMKQGEARDIKVTFPSDYGAEHLRNADVTFKVELVEIKQKNFPELTDELAKEFEFESVEDFNNKNREQLLTQNEKKSAQKLHHDIITKLVAENSFDVPKALIKQQKDALMQDMLKPLSQQGFTDEMIKEYMDKWGDELDDKAAFQVRSGLILGQLAKQYEIESTEADFDAKMKETAQMMGKDFEEVKKTYTSMPNFKNQLMNGILEEKVFSKLISMLKID
ncbi:MAG: trigger factor [Bacteriovoracaceae bacterium]|nr:trigger factor [Bacteriovoracaceae bacterium]